MSIEPEAYLAGFSTGLSPNSRQDESTPRSREKRPREDSGEFKIEQWLHDYRDCIRHFVSIAQFDPAAQGLAALLNIRLPFQKPAPPDAPKESNIDVFHRSCNPEYMSVPDNSPTPPTPRAHQQPEHGRQEYFGAGPSSASPSGTRPTNGQPPSPPLEDVPPKVISTSLTKPAWYGWVSPVPYVRRLVITGFDQDKHLKLWFGPSWHTGMWSTLNHERRNVYLASREATWIQLKESYDMNAEEQAPWINPQLQKEREHRLLHNYWNTWNDYRSGRTFDMKPQQAPAPRRPDNGYHNGHTANDLARLHERLGNSRSGSSSSSTGGSQSPQHPDRPSSSHDSMQKQSLKRGMDSFTHDGDNSNGVYCRENGKRQRHSHEQHRFPGRNGHTSGIAHGSFVESSGETSADSRRAWEGGEPVGSVRSRSGSGTDSRPSPTRTPQQAAEDTGKSAREERRHNHSPSGTETTAEDEDSAGNGVYISHNGFA